MAEQRGIGWWATSALESNVGEETTYTVILGSENLAKLTDEQKQIAIDKNLTLA